MSRSGDLGKADLHIHTAIGDGMAEIQDESFASIQTAWSSTSPSAASPVGVNPPAVLMRKRAAVWPKDDEVVST